MIPKQTIDEIFTAAKIEEVVGDFITLKKQGADYVGLCPFHNDKHPSMRVSPRLNIYKCFVCDAGGNAVNFLMDYEKMSYPDALRYLAKKYHIFIEEEQPTKEQISAANERDKLLTLTGYAETYFIDQLFNTEEGRNIGLSYFKERGFSEKTIKHFKLGYNPDVPWDAFTKHALGLDFSEESLLKVGLTKKSESGKLFDFYRGRVIFPIHNTVGKTIGFGGRILKKDERIAKYFNSPESEIYHKSDTLYGFYFARKAIRAKDNVFLVEGYTDVISLFQAGIENVVASSGTALTEGQIKLLASQTKNITVLYDGDTAGLKAALRGIDLLFAAGMNVKVVQLPDGEDPDSFAKSHRDSEVSDYLTNEATNFVLFKANFLSQSAGDDPMKRAEVVNEIIRTIAEIKDPIAQSFYVRECANLFQLSEEMLNVQLRKLVWQKINKKEPQVVDIQEVKKPLPPFEEPSHLQTSIYSIEEQIVIMLMKYGMYQIFVEKTDARQQPICEAIRIDQFIFNDFSEETILFNEPLFQAIYEEYAKIAQTADNQEVIERYFAQHSDPKIQKFAVPYLMNPDRAYSQEWEKRFDITTNSINNNIEKLNNDVICNVNMFKMRILERYSKRLEEELREPHSDDVLAQIMTKLTQVLQRRTEIAKQLGIVITH